MTFFLWGPRLGARADGGDLQRRERLAMPTLAAVALPALVLEEDDLLRQALLDDLGLDRHAGHRGPADRDVAAVVGEEQRPERNLRSGRTDELLHAHGLTLADAILFTTRFDDGVHQGTASKRAGDFKSLPGIVKLNRYRRTIGFFATTRRFWPYGGVRRFSMKLVTGKMKRS